MDAYGEIVRALGRIEGELVEIRRLSERCSDSQLKKAIRACSRKAAL
jgi:hypothetical protein